MERDGAETQELCVQALRSVRDASDADLLATLTELEGLVPHVAGNSILINAAAANELLNIALEAVNFLRMQVAQAALRLLNDGIRDEGLTDILLLDANLTASSAVVEACVSKCWVLDDFVTASVLELSLKLYLRMVQQNSARVFVLLGESIHRLASAALRVSSLCLGRCLAQPQDPCLLRNDLARRFVFQRPTVAAARLFMLLLENVDDLVCQVDSELEEIVSCLAGNIPCAVTDAYGHIVHRALRAIKPDQNEENSMRRNALAPEEFDFYRRILTFSGLSELLMGLKSFNLTAFMDWRKKEVNCVNNHAHDVGFKQLSPQPKQKVVYDGLALSILEGTSKSKGRSIPLYSIVQITREAKKLKIEFVLLPAEGKDPRVLPDPDSFFDSPQTEYVTFKSEAEAATLRTKLLKTFRLDDMEELDFTFLDGVLEDMREALDADVAQKLLKPSCLLWPDLAKQNREANEKTSSPRQRRIMFASTKGLDDVVGVNVQPFSAVSVLSGNGPIQGPTQEAAPEEEQNVSANAVFSPLRQAEDTTASAEKHPNGLAPAEYGKAPAKLTQWRRVSLATTKSCETNSERLHRESNATNLTDETNIIAAANLETNVTLAAYASSSQQDEGQSVANKAMQSRVSAPAVLSKAQEEIASLPDVQIMRREASQESLKRCDGNNNDLGAEIPPSQIAHMTQPTQQAQMPEEPQPTHVTQQRNLLQQTHISRQTQSPHMVQVAPMPQPIGPMTQQPQQTAQLTGAFQRFGFSATQPQLQHLQQEEVEKQEEQPVLDFISQDAARSREELDISQQKKNINTNVNNNNVEMNDNEIDVDSDPDQQIEGKEEGATSPAASTGRLEQKNDSSQKAQQRKTHNATIAAPSGASRKHHKRPAAFTSEGPPLALHRAEMFAAFQQQAVGWKALHEGESVVKLLELVARKVQETKLRKIETAQQAATKLHQKIARKLVLLLEAHKEERRQLQLSFEEKKKKMLAKIEAQIREAEEVPALSLGAPKNTKADKVIGESSKEIQRVVDLFKNEISEKLASANADAALRCT